ncbi:MAG: hypothetical protein GY853_07775 [PVC group bacterium]|nr:hypothetical protein [PVC group bacterium]
MGEIKKEEKSILDLVVEETTAKPKLNWQEFLEKYPPGSEYSIIGWADSILVRNQYRGIVAPTITRYCPQCKGNRFFHCNDNTSIQFLAFQGGEQFFFLKYICRNCGEIYIDMALFIRTINNTPKGDAIVQKLGELPVFGPHSPAQLITLVGKDRDLYLTGRRAESQGMGIGAYSYYRRIVENQKNAIIDKIIKVSQSQHSSQEFIDSLKEAKKETRFTTAIEKIKDGIPESLKMYGHNPLTILHKTLSEGLHAGSDNECLELAKDIRNVLTELAERCATILKDNEKLKRSIGKLFKLPEQPKNKE